MAFIKYEKKELGCVGAFVSAYSKGAILGINTVGTRFYELEEYQSCDLFYDPEKKLIGFKFFKGGEGQQTIHIYNAGIQIFAKGFLPFFGLEMGSVKRLLIIPKEGMKDFLMVKVGG